MKPGPGLRRHLTAGSAFLLTRVTNALFVLVQLALVARGFPAGEAAAFFVYWTVVWVAAMFIRFGFDQFVPKLVARAAVSGDPTDLAGFRNVIQRTLALVCIGVPLVLVVVIPPADLREIAIGTGLCVMGAAAMATSFVLAGLLKGYGHVAASGWSTGFLAPAFSAAAVPIAHAVGGSWTTIAAATTVGLAGAAGVTTLMSVRLLGSDRVSAALLLRARPGLDRDVLPTGLLFGIAELTSWLPLWMAPVLGASDQATAGLYAAIRVSAAFSWAFLAVATVATPLIAAALARYDYARLRSVLKRSAAAGAATTAPLALFGMLAASDLLGLVDASYDAYAFTLVVLIAARLVDAATGPLVEALVLGGHARWELANQLLGAGVIVIVGVGLEPSAGVEAFAWAYAIAFSTQNALRVLQIGWLLRTKWQAVPSPKAPRDPY